jgi:hypothetical protein
VATLVLIPNGRLGNNLFQLSLANYLKIQFPNIEILFPSFPEIGISQSDGYIEALKSTPDVYLSDSQIQIKQIEDFIGKKPSAVIHCAAWGMNSEIYSFSRNYLRSLALTDSEVNNAMTPRNLTFHIRGGDLWQNPWYKRKKYIHTDYSAVPVSFYEKVLQSARIEVEFVVESTVPNWYLKMLRKSLGFDFRTSTVGPVVDFQRISKGCEIGLGVSTFSWMAAFLGNPDKVHIPCLGIFDSTKRPDLDFKFQGWNLLEYNFEAHNWTGTRTDMEWLAHSECTLRS